MKNKIKAVLLVALFSLSLTSLPSNGMFYSGGDDLRLFVDYWDLVPDGNGGWEPGRITHCDNPGPNCIIGPTIEGPCN